MRALLFVLTTATAFSTGCYAQAIERTPDRKTTDTTAKAVKPASVVKVNDK